MGEKQIYGLGKVYRSKEKFLEALEDFSPNVVPLRGGANIVKVRNFAKK